jgi:hypothetical protein
MTDHDVQPLIPDFTALYEASFRDGGFVTPRMACVLWLAALFQADAWRAEADDKFIAFHLPVVARPYARGRWLEEFIAGFGRLAVRLAHGEGDGGQLARCTGEKLALLDVIDLAEALVHRDLIDNNSLASWPEYGVDDQDFDLMRDVLFDSHDVLMLFDPALDGIEGEPGHGSANLHPLDWFKTAAR